METLNKKPPIINETYSPSFNDFLLSETKPLDFHKPTTTFEENKSNLEITSDMILNAERDLYEENKEYYLREYEGEYIALLNGNLIAHNFNFSEVASRAYEQVGYQPILIIRVDRRKRIYKMATPKFK
jgi:hypothetical protein